MPVLVDTSVWLEYFRNGAHSSKLEFLIDEDLVVTNDLILSELVPFLRAKKQHPLVRLLSAIKRHAIDIQWDQIIDFQLSCLENEANGIGISDLIIAQNALQHHCPVYTLDKHFYLMKRFIAINLFAEE